MTIDTTELSTTFRDSILEICPPWLRDTWGGRFMYTLGLHMDYVAEALILGVKARMPGVGTSDADSAIGADRVIERGFAETSEAYEARLSRAFDDWAIAGNPIAVIKQLIGYVSPVIPKIRYVNNGILKSTSALVANWITVEAGSVTIHRTNPLNWDWDGLATDNLSRFWIIIYPGVWTKKVWGDGHFYGDGTTWGSSATPNQVADVKRLVKKWKAAGSQCKHVIIAFDETMFDPEAVPGPPMPDGSWGPEYKIVAGVGVRTRASNALYWRVS